MTYHLHIVTPDGTRFDGQAEGVEVPAICGQMRVLARHIDCVTPLGMGTAKVLTGAGERCAACLGGMLAVINGEAKVVAASFEWADEIDVFRARASLERAEKALSSPDADPQTRCAARNRKTRALVRLRVAEGMDSQNYGFF